MKATIFILFAGLLAVQAANFRVVYVPQLIDLDQLDFEDEDNQFWGLGDVVKNVQHGVNQVGHNIAHTANQVNHNIAKTVNQVNHNVAHTVNTVNHNIAHTANQVGQNVAHTANQVGHNIAVTAQHIGKDLDRMRQAFVHGFNDAEKAFIRGAKPTIEFLIKVGGFSDAEVAWKKVNWKNGHGLDVAIQKTAKDISKLYKNLNKLSGGKLNDLALRVADKIAMSAFPPAGIILEVGIVSFKVAGQLHDITTMVHHIETDAHKGDWAGVAIESFKLFSLIAQDFA